ncbi:MAG: HAD family phosphatase [Planctomycetia bacterium]|nr:HAD family phosphatase [Planctomycetia bacterium]
MDTKFVFFDLGMVLLHFDFSVAARRLDELTGLDGWDILSATLATTNPICEAVETGKMTAEEMYQWVCETFGMTLSQKNFETVHSNIFTPIPETWELVRELKRERFRVGILSNVCETHWEFCRRKWPELFELFDVPLGSFELGARKPGREVYTLAATRAGVKPEEIIFFDDRPDNVAGAAAVGYRAHIFTTTDNARETLREWGVLP